METVIKFDCQIVTSDISNGSWNVMLNGEEKGHIHIGRCGEFSVDMVDGTDTYGDDWHLDSLRKAAAFAARHLVEEELQKGW